MTKKGILMRSTMLLLATAALVATPALATGSHYCNKHHKYDNCDDKPTPTPTPKPTPTPTPKPTPTPTPAPSQNQSQTANGGNANSTSGANAGAVAGATSGSKSNATGGNATGGNATGGAGGSSKSDATGISGGSFGGAASNTNKIGVDSAVYGGDTNATLTGGNQSLRGGDQTLTGGAQTLTGTQALTNDNSSGVAGSGNADVNVDSSDRSVTNYTSKTLFIPPVVPPTPPSQVAIGNIIKETLACGPLQMVVKTQVTGVSRGLLTKSKVDQGFTYDLAPFTDAQGNIVDYRKVDFPDGLGYRMFGSQVVIFSTIIGVSSGGNFAIGGGGGNQSWGQAGGGTSSSMTRLVTNIQIAQCEVGSFKYVPVEREIPVAPKKKGQ